MTPCTDHTQRIARLFHRREHTQWSDKEIKQYKKLVDDGWITNDELTLIERYYLYQRQKGDDGIHRRDLCTFLNNYLGELDRAEAWNVRNRREPKKKVNTLNGEQRTSDDEWKRIGNLARKQLEAFRKRLFGTHE